MRARIRDLATFLPPFLQAHRRRRLAQRLPPGPLQDFLAPPLPSPQTPLEDCVFAVVDFETTGLDPRRDHVISVGLVEIRRLAIPLAGAWRALVSTPRALPERSTVIHGLTDDTLAAGEPLETVMAALLRRLQGKILVAHHARLELGFLQRLCRQLYGAPFICTWLDTRELAQRCLGGSEFPPREAELRLFNLRRRFGLPDYTAHDALYDALATAELFLALLAELNPKLDGRLKDLRPHTG